jgi:uncharacterized Tic20 family protein
MKPSSEERIIAVVSHLSALTMGVGLLVPALFWSENRKKTGYLRFQTLQALGYQSLGYTVWLLAVLLLLLVFYVGLFIIALIAPEAAQNGTIPMVISILIVVGMFGLLAIYLLLPLVGAVLCGMGKDFRYPILGSRLARSLGYQPDSNTDSPDASLDSACEERFAAAMGHFAVIIPIWGLLAPAYLWISHSKHSPFLKFQSAQTTIYQFIVNLLYFGLGFLSVALGILAMVLFGAFTEFGEWTAVAGLMVMTCLLGCTGLIIPLFHILGQWAGLQILRGREYRYPLLGGWVEKLLK